MANVVIGPVIRRSRELFGGEGGAGSYDVGVRSKMAYRLVKRVNVEVLEVESEAGLKSRVVLETRSSTLTSFLADFEPPTSLLTSCAPSANGSTNTPNHTVLRQIHLNPFRFIDKSDNMATNDAKIQ